MLLTHIQETEIRNKGDEMKVRYKKLNITTNALVLAGAMGTKPVYKADGTFVKDIMLFKNDDLMELTTVLVKFGEYDTQDMILDDEDVRDEAIIDFLEKGTKSLKLFHETNDSEENYIEAPLKEAYVTKFDGEFQDVFKGSIVATYKFRDEKDWEIAKALDLSTSIEGQAELEEVTEEITKSSLQEFVDKYKEQFTKLFGDKLIGKILKKENEMTKEEMQKMEDLVTQVAELTPQVEDLTKQVETLTAEKVEIETNAASELEKTNAELENITKDFNELKVDFEKRITKLDNQENTLDIDKITV